MIDTATWRKVHEAATADAWVQFLDANPDDLTSPEDYPDHALVSLDNFRWIVSQLPDAPPALLDALDQRDATIAARDAEIARLPAMLAAAKAEGARKMRERCHAAVVYRIMGDQSEADAECAKIAAVISALPVEAGE